jgi:fibronectin type 3 domain-containing protein
MKMIRGSHQKGFISIRKTNHAPLITNPGFFSLYGGKSMRHNTMLVWISLLTMIAVPGSIASTVHEDQIKTIDLDDDINLLDGSDISSFVENNGQWNAEVLFSARTSYGFVGLYQDGICHLVRTDDDYSPIRLMFLESNLPIPIGIDPTVTGYNYLIGRDPTGWATDCKGYDVVTYTDLWPGIDLVFRNGEAGIKYDLILRPGSDPDDIQFEVATGGSVSSSGAGIMLSGPEGVKLFDSPPVAFYDSNRNEIPSSYRIRGNVYGFDLAPYDEDSTVIIDPEVTEGSIECATYLGGSGDDTIYDMDFDQNGNIYVCGSSSSTNFPTTSTGYQRTMNGNMDCIVSKMDPTYRTLLYSTYIGEFSWENANAIAVLGSGECYVTGHTDSEDFPVTSDAYQGEIKDGSWDVFLLKLDSTGSRLISSTFIGGSGMESVNCMDLGPDGSVFIGGDTGSEDFPVTSDAFQDSLIPGGFADDIFFLQMDLENMTLLYSTYLGGTGFEMVVSMSYKAGHLYMAGMTDSPDFNVTQGAYQTVPGWNDAILMKFDMDTKSFDFSTFFNGNGWTEIYDVVVDDNGEIYCCGQTSSSNLPTMPGSYDPSYNGGWNDAFVMCMDPTGSRLVRFTYVGGSSDERLDNMMMDSDGYLHLSGWTDSSDFPVRHLAFQTEYGGAGGDGVYIKMSSNCSLVPYSTFIGGNGDDSGIGVNVMDGGSEPTIGIGTTSTDLITTTGCYKARSSGNTDLYLIKINLTLPPSPPEALMATDGDSFVNLSWNPPSGLLNTSITGYEVWRGLAANSMELLMTTDVKAKFNDSTAKNGKVYWYGVRSVNRIGAGDLSLLVQAKPGAVPDPPLSVKAEHGNSVVNITWTAPNNDGGYPITGYRVYRVTDGNPVPVSIDVDPNDVRFSDDEVENGNIYRYWMTALNERGESSRSTEVNATPMARPGRMLTLFAESGSRFVVLSWEPPVNNGGGVINCYILYRGDQYKAIVKFKTLSAEVLSFNDTGLMNGVTYRYQISSMNTEGEGLKSEIVEAVPLSVPTAPRNFVVEAGDHVIELSWDPPSDAGGTPVTGFSIRRSVDGSDWALIETCPSTEYSYSDKDVENGRVYHYRLSARNTVGESQNVESNATPMGLPGPVGSISLEPGDGYAVISWSAPGSDGGSPIIGYDILRGEGESSLSTILTTGPSIFEYNDTTVKNGKTYWYSVRPTNTIGTGPLVGSVRVMPCGLPSMPLGASIESGDGWVSIRWNPPSDDGGLSIKEIRIYLIDENDARDLLYSSDMISGIYRHTSLTNGKTYRYILTSVNGLGESGPTLEVHGNPSGKPSQPLSVTSNVLGNKVIVNWLAPLDDGGSPLKGYRIYRSQGLGPESQIGEVDATVMTYTDSSVETGSNYRYRIAAFNVNGESPSTDPIGVVLEEDSETPVALFIGIGIVLLILVIISLVAILVMRRIGKKNVQPPYQMQMYLQGSPQTQAASMGPIDQSRLQQGAQPSLPYMPPAGEPSPTPVIISSPEQPRMVMLNTPTGSTDPSEGTLKQP